MFDLNTLPLPGGVVLAGLIWGGTSALILGPLIAERSIERLDWPTVCTSHLQNEAAARAAPQLMTLNPSCTDLGGLADALLGVGAGQALCQSGAGQMLDHMSALSMQMEAVSQAQALLASEAQVALDAPHRCSCAAQEVSADRLGWGLAAGTFRLAGRDGENLEADLLQALHGPACAREGQR